MKCRFAPSPTGYLHAGNARTAILNWLWARSHNNSVFMLRIDDTDDERSKSEYETAIREDLTWLGIDWDSEAKQSERLDIYTHAIETLKAKNLVYPCYETAEELALKRKMQLNMGKPPVYDRAALELDNTQIKKYEEQGRQPHWRFKLDHSKIIAWQDMNRGDVSIQSNSLSDPVLIREDGRVLYTLSSVVDDGDFAMTHIVRGSDHVVNSAAQIQLLAALDYDIPIFAHVPLLNGHDGQKLSKRHGNLGLRELKNDGIDANAISLYLAQLGTSYMAEPATKLYDYAKNFDFSDYGKANPRFDHDELWRWHQETLRHHDYKDVKAQLADYISEEFWQNYRENIGNDIKDIEYWWQICHGDIVPMIDDEDKDMLNQAARLLKEMTQHQPFDSSLMKQWTKNIGETSHRKGKALFLPLRKALTGLENGPKLDDLITVMGVDKAIKRLST